MLKENKRTLIITSILTILPVLIGLFLWNLLPNQMATHFGMNNEADGFSSKVFAVFGLPLFLLVMQWFCALIISRDPRKQNISPKMFTLVLWIMPFLSLFLAAIMYSYNLGYQMNISFISELLIGMLFIIIGNYMPKARQSYTIGIRIPWTLDNEENWNRTHRLAGYLWVAGGILMLIIAFTGILEFKWMLAILLALTLIPSVYSYLLHVKHGL